MSSRLLRINDWERLALEAEFRPAQMAALCPASQRQLARFFAEKFGKTPELWCRQLRCRCAMELLGKGYSNKAVVQELFFASESHLCHEFQALLGKTPQCFALTFSPKPATKAKL